MHIIVLLLVFGIGASAFPGFVAGLSLPDPALFPGVQRRRTERDPLRSFDEYLVIDILI